MNLENLIPRTEKTKIKEKDVYKNTAILYNSLLYNNNTDEKKVEIDKKYDPRNLFLKGYKYDQWYKKDEEKSKSQPEETIF